MGLGGAGEVKGTRRIVGVSVGLLGTLGVSRKFVEYKGATTLKGPCSILVDLGECDIHKELVASYFSRIRPIKTEQLGKIAPNIQHTLDTHLTNGVAIAVSAKFKLGGSYGKLSDGTPAIQLNMAETLEVVRADLKNRVSDFASDSSWESSSPSQAYATVTGTQRDNNLPPCPGRDLYKGALTSVFPLKVEAISSDDGRPGSLSFSRLMKEYGLAGKEELMIGDKFIVEAAIARELYIDNTSEERRGEIFDGLLYALFDPNGRGNPIESLMFILNNYGGERVEGLKVAVKQAVIKNVKSQYEDLRNHVSTRPMKEDDLAILALGICVGVEVQGTRLTEERVNLHLEKYDRQIGQFVKEVKSFCITEEGQVFTLRRMIAILSGAGQA